MLKNAIFLAFDTNHWKYAAACINSIKRNFPLHPDLLVYYKGDDQHALDYLNSEKHVTLLSNLDFPDFGNYHKKVQSEMVYCKYLLWSSLFSDYNNVLYLDSDTLVLSSLEDLFKLKEPFIVSNNLSFKEARIFKADKTRNPKLISSLNKYNISFPRGRHSMANAGVIMMPKWYRTWCFYDSLMSITEDMKEFFAYADQSAISLLCHYRNIRISRDYRYNFQTPLYGKAFFPRYPGTPPAFLPIKSYLDEIKILHFSGPKKPGMKSFAEWPLLGRQADNLVSLYNRYSVHG